MPWPSGMENDFARLGPECAARPHGNDGGSDVVLHARQDDEGSSLTLWPRLGSSHSDGLAEKYCLLRVKDVPGASTLASSLKGHLGLESSTATMKVNSGKSAADCTQEVQVSSADIVYSSCACNVRSTANVNKSFAVPTVIPQVDKPYDYSNRQKWIITTIVTVAAAAAPMGAAMFYRKP